MQEAERFLKAMLKRGLIPGIDVFNTLIARQCKEGNIREAFEMYSRMSRQGLVPDTVAFTSLMDGLCKIEQEIIRTL